MPTATPSKELLNSVEHRDLETGALVLPPLAGKGVKYSLNLGPGGTKTFTTGGREAKQWSESDGDEYTMRAAEFRLADGRTAYGAVMLDLNSSGEHQATVIVLEDGVVQQGDADFAERIGGAVFPYHYKYAGTCDDIHVNEDGPDKGWSNTKPGESLATPKGPKMAAKKNGTTKAAGNGKAATKKTPAKKAPAKKEAPAKPPVSPTGKRERDRPTNQVVIAMGNAAVDYLADQSPKNQKALAEALKVIQDQWPAFRRATTDSK